MNMESSDSAVSMAFKSAIERCASKEAFARTIEIQPQHIKRYMQGEAQLSCRSAMLFQINFGTPIEVFRPKDKEIFKRYVSFHLMQKSQGPAQTQLLSAIHIPYQHMVRQECLEQMKHLLANHGMLRPIAITEDNALIYGHCRYRAAKELGWKEVPVIRIDVEQLWHCGTPDPLLLLALNQAERFKLAYYCTRRFSGEALPEYPPELDEAQLGKMFQGKLPDWVSSVKAPPQVKHRSGRISYLCGLGKKDVYNQWSKVRTKGLYLLKRLIETGYLSLRQAYALAKLPKARQEAILFQKTYTEVVSCLKALRKSDRFAATP